MLDMGSKALPQLQYDETLSVYVAIQHILNLWFCNLLILKKQECNPQQLDIVSLVNN